MKEIDAFILAAGLGTRMGPLSMALPKPAWTLLGKPLLQWGADDLRGAGFQTIACNAHLHPERLRRVAQGINVFDEPVLMGSAGGLLRVRARCTEPLAVWNGDAIARIPWQVFRESHRQSGAALSWLLMPHPGGPWTKVWLDAQGRVLRGADSGIGPFLFTGASLWSARALSLLPEGPSDTRSILTRLDPHIGVVVETFPWREIGTPQALLAAATEMAPQHEGRFPGCYVHPEGFFAGQLERCVLGPGARPHPAMRDQDAFWFEDSGRQVRLALNLRPE